jgi:endoglucanase
MFINKFMRSLVMALAALGVCISTTRAAPDVHDKTILWGVNDSGLDFGHGNIAGTNFAIPNPGYYLAHGVQLVRIPFQITRLQLEPDGPLAPAIVQDLQKIIAEDHEAGAITVLDPHGYGFFNIDGKPQDILQNPEAASAYIDFMRRVAETFEQDDVAIGLMNEPHTGSDTDYAKIWNRAIQAIRQAGFRGVILVPHAHWSAAADIAPDRPYQGQINDPDKNWVLEVHSYLDPDGTGTYKQTVASEDIGVQRLAGVIAWSRQSGIRVFLGETGGPADATSLAALRKMFAQISAAPDVFWGVAMWGGGAWWKPNYPMRLDPINGVDRPQFIALENVMTPEILYLAKDPGAADIQVKITVNGKDTHSESTVTASRYGAPQRVPVRYMFRPGMYTIKIQPETGSGNLYFVGSTWKGISNSASNMSVIPETGYQFQVNVPAG